jgi:hypothetical protein
MQRGAQSFSIAALFAVSALACSRNELTFEDSEGQRYTARCRENGCSVADKHASDAGAEPTLRTSGRIVGICRHAAGKRTDTPAQCRPLVCQADKGCPPAHGLGHGTCVNGLCTEPSQPLAVGDAVMLCMAGTGWGTGSPPQVERYALALNCGTPCRVPTPCRQP